MTLLVGTHKNSVFGYGFLPGMLALVVWSIGTSGANFRATPTSAREVVSTQSNT